MTEDDKTAVRATVDAWWSDFWLSVGQRLDANTSAAAQRMREDLVERLQALT